MDFDILKKQLKSLEKKNKDQQVEIIEIYLNYIMEHFQELSEEVPIRAKGRTYSQRVIAKKTEDYIKLEGRYFDCYFDVFNPDIYDTNAYFIGINKQGKFIKCLSDISRTEKDRDVSILKTNIDTCTTQKMIKDVSFDKLVSLLSRKCSQLKKAPNIVELSQKMVKLQCDAQELGMTLNILKNLGIQK